MITSLFAAALGAAPIKHEFVAIDEGLAHLLYVNENAPSKNWVVPVGQPQARDLQLIGGNRLLVGHDTGYAEFDLATGKKLVEVASYKGVASARRLPNGHTLLTGVNLGGATGVVVLEIDAANTVVNKIVYPGNYVRLMRQTAKGTFLLMTDTTIREGDAKGTHSVSFDWPHDRLILTNETLDRAAYAEGVILACSYALRLPPGLHYFENLADGIIESKADA